MTTAALTVGESRQVGTPIVARNGKVTGHKFTLGCGPIAAARKAYKLANPKASNRDASVWIGEQLAASQGSLARLGVQAAIEAAYASGMHGTQFELRDKSAVLRFAVTPVVKDAKAEAAVKLATDAVTEKAVTALMGKLSCTREEALAML